MDFWILDLFESGVAPPEGLKYSSPASSTLQAEVLGVKEAAGTAGMFGSWSSSCSAVYQVRSTCTVLVQVRIVGRPVALCRYSTSTCTKYCVGQQEPD